MKIDIFCNSLELFSDSIKLLKTHIFCLSMCPVTERAVFIADIGYFKISFRIQGNTPLNFILHQTKNNSSLFTTGLKNCKKTMI